MSVEELSGRGVPGCGSCGVTGTGIRIDRKCLLHYVVINHTLEEIKEAIQEVERAPDIIMKEEQKVGTFSSRAKESLQDRRIVPFSGHYGQDSSFTGDNIFFRGRRAKHSKVYHTDKNCPHLPGGSLTAYPESYVKGLRYKKTCSYCTRLNDE